jgi:hypothetical protein
MDYQTIIKLHEMLMTINLKVEEHIYIKKSFLRFFVCLYLEIHCQSYQNNSLLVDPTLIRNRSMEPIPTKYFDADDPTCQ